jgi:1-deoxy-D-xylulose-5-phosphate synthase
MTYLNKINSPDDLKKLEVKKLDKLAAEIRTFLINSIAKTGGHLASNLGVVELTIALHYCLNCPKDKIIWDVGHQAYTHKILTGRKNEFASLRKLDGLSGFPQIKESPYDSFTTGHSSTSISAALGLAMARDLKGESFNVAAVLGDGAMTGGLVYEAMNNAGRSKAKMLIVLNDNQMSISENVGAISQYLSELRMTDKYMDAKSDIKKTLESVPIVGRSLTNIVGKTKDSLKYTIMPNVMFEQMGLKYIGPVDGHDIKKLVHIINKIKKMNCPVLLHVITQKGRGYKPAEIAPSKYHGVGSFEVATGEMLTKSDKPTYSNVFSEKLIELAKKDKRVCGITAAMPSGTGMDAFAKEFPDRMFDVGIAEGHAVTFGAGLAKCGMVPFFAVYSTFLQRSYDQIIHDVCIQKLHVVFAVDRAGIVGDDGCTHQGIYDLSFMGHIPGLTVMAPKNKYELGDMLEFALGFNGPISLRYPRGSASEILKSARKVIEYGKSELVYKGEKIALLSVGAMADEVVGVYEKLLDDGYSPELINVRFVSPIDREMVERVSKDFDYIFSFEDNIHAGGFGCLLDQMLAEMGCKATVKNFAFPDTYIEQGTRCQLFERYGMNRDGLYARIKEILADEN